MATITEDYVSFETAKLLKRKGFDKYPLFPCYKEDNGKFIDIPTTLDTINYCFIPAPTLQMAMKWLREVYNLFLQITVDFSDGAYPMYDVCVVNLGICTSNVVNGYDRYSYKEACEAAIKYCLENLKENNYGNN